MRYPLVDEPLLLTCSLHPTGHRNCDGLCDVDLAIHGPCPILRYADRDWQLNADRRFVRNAADDPAPPPVPLPAVAEAAARFRDTWGASAPEGCLDSVTRWGGDRDAAAVVLAAEGIGQAASTLGIAPVDLLRLFFLKVDTADPWIRFEAALAAPGATVAAAAATVDGELTRDQCYDLARLLGADLRAGVRQNGRPVGRSLREHAEILAAHEAGRSHRDIGMQWMPEARNPRLTAAKAVARARAALEVAGVTAADVLDGQVAA